jgi:hypothetical protein
MTRLKFFRKSRVMFCESSPLQDVMQIFALKEKEKKQ